MATLSKTWTFSASTTARAAEVNTNFDDIISFINNSVIHVDGSKAFTGLPNLPASDPTTANQPTRKSYVDAGDDLRPKVFGHNGRAAGPTKNGNGGFLLQMGSQVVTTNVGGDATITFPSAFPTGLLTVVVTHGSATTAPNDLAISTYNHTISNFVVSCKSLADPPGGVVGSVQVHWIALGW